jgi:hypothetical protein
MAISVYQAGEEWGVASVVFDAETRRNGGHAEENEFAGLALVPR